LWGCGGEGDPASNRSHGQDDGGSDFEKSDYMATLASALDGLGRKRESEEAQRCAEEFLERARKEAKQNKYRG